jgi:tRNA (guanosine-2'-O-)-methyltransferase
MDQELITYLEGFITDRRKKLFRQVLEQRTRYLTVVLEDLYQSHNASAVLRSCECFGIQDVHIIENRNKYTVNPDIALGSSKWLNLIRYNRTEDNTEEAIRHLKAQGYRIVVTVPGEDAVPLDRFDLSAGKAALLFGTELTGLSKTALSLADEKLMIPMYGFTESFNISVSAGIILSHLVPAIHKTDGWQLSEEEKSEIYLDWLKTSIKSSEQIIQNHKKQQKKS